MDKQQKRIGQCETAHEHRTRRVAQFSGREISNYVASTTNQGDES